VSGVAAERPVLYPHAVTKHQVREALNRVAAGKPTRGIALSCAVGHSTISGLKARHAAEV
jgi:hypothetical protein